MTGRRQKRSAPSAPRRPLDSAPFAAIVIDGVDDAVLVADARLNVVGWNASMERMTGIPREQALGRTADAVVPFLADTALKAHLQRALDGQVAASGELPYRLPDSERQGWVEVRYVPWRDRRGRIAGVIGFHTDVSERRRQALFMRAIEAIGHSLTSSLDLNEVLDTIVGKALEVMGAESALVVSGDGRAPVFEVMRAAGRLSGEYVAAGSIPVAGGPISRAILQARPITTPNVQTDPETWLDPARRAQIAREGFKAVAAAPLVSKRRVHGALVVHYWSERVFSDEDHAALTLLAEQAALAIDNARVYADATRRADRLRELATVEQLVAKSLDVDDVLGRIARAAARLLGAAVVHAWVADPAARVLRRRAGSVPAGTAALAAPATVPFGSGLIGRAVDERLPTDVADVTEEPEGASVQWASEAGLRRLLVVPIVAGDTVLGVLALHAGASARWTDEERALVTSLAARAAVAMQNARAYADAIHRAQRLHDLVAVSQSITASLDTTDVMQRIANAAGAMTPGALAAVHVFDGERGTLRFAARCGAELDGLPDERPVDAGLPGLAAMRRTPVLVAEPLAHPSTLALAWWRLRPTATYYGVPIVLGDTLVGVLDYILPEGLPDREEQEALRLLAAQAGVAIRNASLYQAQRLQATRIRALAGVNQRLSGALDLDELLRTISESAAQLTDVRFVSFWLADEKRRELSFRGGSVAEIADDFPGGLVSYDEGEVGWIARHRAPLAVDDVVADPRTLHRAWWTRWGLRAFIGYPVLAGEELLAILVLSHAEPIRFAADTPDVIDMFVAQASVAVQNARLYREARQRRDVAEVLARLARELAGALDAQRIADLVTRGVVDLLGVRGSAVYRLDTDTGALHALASFGADAAATRDLVLPPGEGVAGRAVAQRAMIVTSDIFGDPRIWLSPAVRRRLEAHDVGAAVGVPLITQERVIGALALGDRSGREFFADELQALQAFADQVALAFETARLYASAHDSLTRLRDTQVQLVQAAKMSALGQLVSGVAHELNNPLSVVIGYGQLLLAREVPDTMRRPVELMVSQGDRMAKIVRNLLFFARQRPPERVPVDLRQVIEQTLALRLNQLTLSGITVDKDFAEDLPLISADAQQLEQVFLNLLLNAEQAILDARPGGCIVLRARLVEGGEAVAAQIIDDGPGIAPDLLSRVFEPFFTTKTVGSGTGLGLSVSYGIVAQHGGRLSVQSEPGRTVFTLELPVARTTGVAAEPAPVETPVVNAEGRLALLVEDEPSVVDLIMTLLGISGWRVDIAPGGRAGLEHVRRQHYDLIVSDMRMPDGSGEEFYHAAIAHDPTLRHRFLFITGDTANEDAWAFLRELDIPILEKPFPPAQFLGAVQQLTMPL